MPIEFHCDHCQTIIRAPMEAGGKKGRCPKCQNVVYIPLPPEDTGEIPLAPEDPEDEKRRAAAERERHAIQQMLLKDRVAPGDGGPRQPRGAGPAGPGGAAPAPAVGDVRKAVAEFLAAMAEGRLDAAERQVTALSTVKTKALSMIELMSTDEQMAADFPKLPRPVVMGFLKQLRGRLG